MHTIRVIPCLDVNNGRVVKGVNFVNLIDAGDPVECALAYDKAGADEVVFLDITASCDGRETVVDMVREVAKKLFIPFTVGGGIRTVDDFKVILREGADKVAVNSAAIKRPELISEAAQKFGSQCVVVAIDLSPLDYPFDRRNRTSPSTRRCSERRRAQSLRMLPTTAGQTSAYM